MLVDAHQHLWVRAITPQPWIDGSMAAINRDFTVADLRAAVGGQVDRTVLVQTVCYPDETNWMLELAASEELIGAVIGWVDLTAADVGEQLDRVRAGSGGRFLAGIRHQVQAEADPRWLLRPDVMRGLAAVGQRGLSYDVLTLPHQLGAAVEVAARLPEVTFVLDHLSKPDLRSGDLDGWAAELAALASLDNVHAKLSGLVTEAAWSTWTVDDLRPAVDHALAVFGPDRLLFGSDWPVCVLAAEASEVVGVTRDLLNQLSPAEQAQVFGENARHLYRID